MKKMALESPRIYQDVTRLRMRNRRKGRGRSGSTVTLVNPTLQPHPPLLQPMWATEGDLYTPHLPQNIMNVGGGIVDGHSLQDSLCLVVIPAPLPQATLLLHLHMVVADLRTRDLPLPVPVLPYRDLEIEVDLAIATSHLPMITPEQSMPDEVLLQLGTLHLHPHPGHGHLAGGILDDTLVVHLLPGDLHCVERRDQYLLAAVVALLDM